MRSTGADRQESGRLWKRRGAILVAAGLAALALPAVGSQRAQAAAPAPSVYVVEQASNQLLPVATATGGAGAPTTVGAMPSQVAITPDAGTAYVSNSGDGTLTPVDLGTGAASAPVHLGAGSDPTGVAISPDGSSAWVAATGLDQLIPVSLSSSQVGPGITVGLKPTAVAITPDGYGAYVSDSGSAAVTPVDLRRGVALAPIPVGAAPSAIAITPDGRTVYVADTTAGTVTPIAASNNPPTPGLPIPVGASPVALAVSPDGSSVWVANKGSDTITPISVRTNQAGTPIPLPPGDAPTAIAFSPDGTHAYVTAATQSGGGVLLAVASATGSVQAVLSGLSAPVALAAVPDQAPLARLSTSIATPGTSGTPVTFDASASTVRYGTITSYEWFFGDGTPPVTTVGPQITHTYGNPGTYQAAVLETDTAGTSYQPSYTGQTASRNVPAPDGVPQSVALATLDVNTSALVTTPAGAPALYVADPGANTLALSPIAPYTGSPSRSTLGAGSGPAFVAVSPDGSGVVVTDFVAGTVTPLAACTASSGQTSYTAGPAAPSGSRPEGVAVSPVPLAASASGSQWLVLVADSGSDDVRQYVLTVNSSPCAASLAPLTQHPSIALPVGSAPFGVAIAPDGSGAYVSDSGLGLVTPINLSSAQPGPPVPVGLDPQGLAITPDGKTVYVADTGSDSLTPITTSGTIPGRPIPTGSKPYSVAVSPDGAQVYVTDSGTTAVTPVSTATNTPGAPIPTAGYQPADVTFSPDGGTAYVTSFTGGAVVPIATANQTAGAPVTGYTHPLGVAESPDVAPYARLGVSASPTANQPVTFDASASTVKYGTITSYLWYFGDSGTPVVTTTPTVTHTYTSPGTYSALVVETDSAGTSYTTAFTGRTASRYAPKVDGIPQDARFVSFTVASGTGGTIANGTPSLYVANPASDTLTPLGLSNPAAPVPSVPLAAGGGPAFAAATPDGRALVVSDYTANTVTPIAVCPGLSGTLQYRVGSAAPTGTRPLGVAVSPVPTATGSGGQTSWRVLVVDSGNGDVREYTLTVTSTTGSCSATLAPQSSSSGLVIPVGAQPFGVAITPDGATAFVSDQSAGSVTPIDLASGQPGPPIPVGSSPSGLAVTPDGKMLYVVDSGSNAVTPISTATRLPAAPIAVGSTPYAIAITADGSQAFVTNTASDTVTPIALATNTAGAAIALPAGDGPGGITISPDGSTAYVTSYTTGTVIPFGTTAGHPVQPSLSGFNSPLGAVAAVTPAH